jgi:hypothetical protein
MVSKVNGAFSDLMCGKAEERSTGQVADADAPRYGIDRLLDANGVEIEL